MDTKSILTKRLTNVTVPDVHAYLASSGRLAYALVLETAGKWDVHVGEWKDEEFAWDDAVYDKSRKIAFRSLIDGSGGVNDSGRFSEMVLKQYLRHEEKKICTVLTKANLSGVPFADSYSIITMEVFKSLEAKDSIVVVKSGVQFETNLPKKTRNSIQKETMKSQKAFYTEFWKAGESAVLEYKAEAAKAAAAEKARITSFKDALASMILMFHTRVRSVIPMLTGNSRAISVGWGGDEITSTTRKIQESMKVLGSLANLETETDPDILHADLSSMHQSLDDILDRMLLEGELDESTNGSKCFFDIDKFVGMAKGKPMVVPTEEAQPPFYVEGLSDNFDNEESARGSIAPGNGGGTVNTVIFLQTPSLTEITFGQDEALQQMDIILTRTVAGLTMNDFQDLCLSFLHARADDCYSDFLTSSGKSQVRVGVWSKSGTLIGEWDNEPYQKRRLVAYEFEYASPLYTGVRHAIATQKQYVRMENNGQRLILATSTDFSELPFADAFSVETRKIVQRVGPMSLAVRVGFTLVCHNEKAFKKSYLKRLRQEMLKMAKNDQKELLKMECSVARSGNPLNNAQSRIKAAEGKMDEIAKLSKSFFEGVDENENVRNIHLSDLNKVSEILDKLISSNYEEKIPVSFGTDIVSRMSFRVG